MLTLKVYHQNDLSGAPFSLYGGLSSVHFYSQNGENWAKTEHRTLLENNGFVAHEDHIVLAASAYVMNESGKTIAQYHPNQSGAVSSLAQNGSQSA